ncbi:MAG TPA: tetratricopeptide repeat protein, partial [Candidatus Eremiobacteraceae bacterium]|nr:tetratricopeptide repeat protein [Candidatus Eremiobacteraceae bacterium]
THPQQVFQLIAADLPAEFPALRSLDALPNNLPLQVTSLIGREQDVVEVRRLLEKTHLLTLAGPGGVGKTRLALQAAADVLDQYPDGVWVIEFGDLTDPDLVAAETSSVLGVGIASDRSLTDSIVYSLRPKSALIIFDNCEHLIRPVTTLVSAIIHACPKVRVIATSREVLGTAGETVQRVSSLAVPPATEELSLTSALQYGAVALFVDRATAVNTRFTLTDGEAPIVAGICRRLDGIPFAIELAAARVKAMSVASLAERLNQRFRILTGGDRTGMQRQQTMRALIDWSYNLLSEEEKVLLNRVSIFAGGWTVDAAEAICVDEESELWAVLDLITSLVDKSLVVADLSVKGDRYRLLDSTREYALERLKESGEQDRIARAHARFFLEMAERSSESWHTSPTLAWLSKLEPETDNFRAVLEWTLSQKHDVDLGAAMVDALDHFWYDDGLHQEGRGWISAALAAIGQPESKQQTEVTASLLLSLSQLQDARTRLEAAERARSLYESLENKVGVARAQRRIAYGLYQLGRSDEAEAACRAAMPVLRSSGDSREVADCTARLGSILWQKERNEEALSLLSEALIQARKLAYDDLVSAILTNMAETKFSQGDVLNAITHAREAIAWDQRLKNQRNVAIDFANLTSYHIALEQFEEARQYARQALRLSRAAHAEIQIGIILQHFAMIAAMTGSPERAVKLIGFAEAAFGGAAYRREVNEAREYEKLLDAIRQQLTTAEIEHKMAEGAALSEEDAIEEALRV